ncbi:MAG: phenylalanine--tRNA ligase subunit beta [Ignavibacteria bacterium]|nr:phenylalanine--tRNA ligase subunit beta [Ignavibacteria bacterium]
MKISLNWLKNYIDISNLTVEEIEKSLTMSGLEVESIERIGESLQGFIVGEVTSREAHPNADKLSLCEVSNGTEVFQVVCGAPNVAEGQKIVFARVGTIMPETGEKLKKVKIRGVESHGMICSEKELQLGDDHTGIVVLSSDASVGKSLVEHLNLSDTVLELGITPNRPDALSHIGVARELSAILKKKYCLPKIDFDEVDEKIEDLLKVEIENEIDSPRYCAKYVKNVKIKESPQWLKNYLNNIGIRPINNVVDISNFVMMEYGQPLHTFDAKLIEGRKIIIKNASEGERFITLDEKERILTNDTLMICDENRKIAIAGVMGGENSEISESTKDVIIESAYFNPKSIRKTSKRLGLSTESSYRFERGVDFNNTLNAALRAAQLISELADGEIVSGDIDEYPNKLESKEIELRIKRVTNYLGFEISRDKICEILESLGFEVRKQNGGELICTVPSFRPDVEGEADLIEEIARIYGYDNIPLDSRISFNISTERIFTEQEYSLREILTGFGLSEVINNTLLNESDAIFNSKVPMKILNPISQELSHLRTSLIPCLVKNVSSNNKFSEFDLSFYEIGNCVSLLGASLESFNDFVESRNLAICLTGLAKSENWKEKSEKVNLLHLKGLTEALFEKISLDKVSFTSYNNLENIFYSIEIKVFIDATYIGSLYQLDEAYLQKFDIENPVIAAEFNLDLIKSLPKRTETFKSVSNFPKVNRDISFYVADNISFREIEAKIYSLSDKLLINTFPFDLYRDEKLAGKKSIAIRLEFQSYEKTLTTEEIEKKLDKIVKGLEKEFNIQLRSSINES